MIELHVQELCNKLQPWATQIAIRFGRPVFLVGSALELCEPRDIDVRVEISQEEFESRYGNSREWHRSLWFPNRNDGSMKYAADMWDIAREASLVLKMNIDFAVQPPVEYEQYAGKKKVQISRSF